MRQLSCVALSWICGTKIFLNQKQKGKDKRMETKKHVNLFVINCYRDEYDDTHVSSEMGIQLAREINAVAYVEFSSSIQLNVKEGMCTREARKLTSVIIPSLFSCIIFFNSTSFLLSSFLCCCQRCVIQICSLIGGILSTFVRFTNFSNNFIAVCKA